MMTTSDKTEAEGGREAVCRGQDSSLSFLLQLLFLFLFSFPDTDKL